MSKHTPGPWFIDLDELGEETNIYASHLRPGSRASICEMNMEKMTWSDEQSLANSRLISAAPDLLEALIRARDDLNNAAFLIRKELGEHHWLYGIEKGKKIADEAIAKARVK